MTANCYMINVEVNLRMSTVFVVMVISFSFPRISVITKKAIRSSEYIIIIMVAKVNYGLCI